MPHLQKRYNQKAWQRSTSKGGTATFMRGVLRREPSLDFLTAQAAGLRALKDLDVLALAAEQQRVLISHDVGTMPAHFR
jgi:hypothetical protein